MKKYSKIFGILDLSGILVLVGRNCSGVQFVLGEQVVFFDATQNDLPDGIVVQGCPFKWNGTFHLVLQDRLINAASL